MNISEWVRDIQEIKREKPRLDEVNYHWVLRIINRNGTNPKPEDILDWIKNEKVDARRF